MAKNQTSMYRNPIKPQKRHDPERSSPKHITVKLSKVQDKEKILKPAGANYQVTFTDIPIN